MCGILGLLLVAANFVLLSVDVGTALPGILDGQWSLAYTQYVVQPLTEFLNSNAVNKVLVAALWGLAGFLAYIGVEFLWHAIKTWRESRTNIQMARGNVVAHPLINTIWAPLFWRLGVLVGGILFLIAMQPLLRRALDAAPQLLFTKNLLMDGLKALMAIAIWALFLHGIVVFLRLFSQRTRLFGDDELY